MGVAFAQSTVSGTVSSAEDGNPIAGAAVLVKGTASGAYTDENGQFAVSVPEGATTLLVSFFGKLTQEVEIEGRSTIDIQLTEDVSTLDEVLVTGYGTQKAKEVTSSIVSVKAEDFNKGNVNDVSQLLQGKVAGLSISRAGGDPNAGFSIRLRGLSTLGAQQSPLVVIDGVIGADLSSVDPNDIASIDVLKDGSAAAIYGTRGSSGVIIITTKTGEAGVAKVTYNGYIAAEEIANSIDVASASEYRDLFINNRGTGTDYGASTDWLDEVTRTGISHVHNVALSGGSGQTTYRISGNFRDVQGVAEKTGFEQINTRINLTQRALNDKLKITLNVGLTLRDQTTISGQVLRQAIIYNPTAPVRSSAPEHEQWGGFFQADLFDFFNPVAALEQNDFGNEFQRFNGNILGEYEIIDGLVIGGRYSQQRQSFIFERYSNSQDRLTGFGRTGFAEQRTDETFFELAEATLTYSTNLGDLGLTALAGYSYQDFEFRGFGANGGNFITDEFGANNLGAALDFANGLGGVFSYKSTNRLIAGFARANLNWADTYFLNLTYRREGSSRFGEGNKWGDFGAVSAGATLSNLFDVPWIDNLKVRASWGRTGNQPGESYLSLLRIGPTGGNFFFNGEFLPAFGPSSNPNPDLKWEVKDEYNFGVDFSMLAGRLNGSIDYYIRQTTDLLFEIGVPVPPNLVATTLTNLGQIDNSGVEFVASYLAVDKPNFTWTPAVNFATYNTEIVSLSTDDAEFGDSRNISNLGSPGQNNRTLIRVIEGEEIGQIYGPILDGIDETGAQVFRDVNGDGVLNADDDQLLGSGLQDFDIGINNTITYGNWDLNFFLRGSFGHDLINTYRAFYEYPSVTGTWNAVVTDNFDERLSNTETPAYNSSHVEDADFIRLDNATLGYTLPTGDNSPFRRLRLYMSGQNLFTITGYSGADPEVRTGDGNGGALAPGIDRRNTYFLTRTYTFGVNLEF